MSPSGSAGEPVRHPDLTVTNFGGGNTSAKLVETDPLTGTAAQVLWVKGSGGDIGSISRDGFATLYQDKLLGLEAHYSGPDDDDKMVGYLPHCTFNLNGCAASIDTPLHALLPFAHVDHVHPDAVIALAASSGGEAATRAIWGGRIGWLGWKRPGYTLGVQLRDFVAANPAVEGVMLAGHGIICWAETARDCYEHTVTLIADAANYLNAKLAEKPAFGGQKVAPLTLAPLCLKDDAYLAKKITDYRAMYAAYYERCKRPNSPAMRDANPVVVLVPGVGRMTFATDKTTARLAGEFYGNAINVMRGAEAIGDYIALDEQEAFDIEYWLLEEAKLQRMPAPKPMVGRIALVTGGAGGIGAATAARLMAEGACVMLADRDASAVQEVCNGFAKRLGKDAVRAFASSAPITETTVALWRKNYDVLAEGYFLTARSAWPLLERMKDQGGTAGVFISSKNAVAATAGARSWRRTIATGRCWGATYCPRMWPKPPIGLPAMRRQSRPAI